MGRQFRWAFKLTRTDFEIKYKPQCDSKPDDDALARRMTFTTISVVHFSNLDEWEDDAQIVSRFDNRRPFLIASLVYPTDMEKYSTTGNNLYSLST
jgi:hypothetical protein